MLLQSLVRVLYESVNNNVKCGDRGLFKKNTILLLHSQLEVHEIFFRISEKPEGFRNHAFQKYSWRV